MVAPADKAQLCFPLGFALRSSTEVYGVSLLHLCVHMSMWKEREGKGKKERAFQMN